ncbi:hypothetical protein CspeluHIS016_0300020 [Cutaneotrichosporon spelunceum]|uniref:Uncharacterized protein n=1 Tax=Cutaneotrichosporon spelunceum TaxID=1672016 RepID=A0AAD3TSR5_9TREE|nr:hypothetical protein CspeluHIS016_0300020 [Cutaneotrichosporon spelunceum]
MLGTERALDSAAYPHIAEFVLDVLVSNLASSRSPRCSRSLLALRLLNRATRDRVDGRLSYRFMLHDRRRHPAFTGLTLGAVLSVSDESASIASEEPVRPRKRARVEQPNHVLRTRRGVQAAPPLHTTDLTSTERKRRARSLLRYTRLLDLGEYALCPELRDAFTRPELFASIFPNVQVLRMTGDRFPTFDAGTQLPPAVWFRHLNPAPEGRAVHYRLDPVPTSRLVWSVDFDSSDMALHYDNGGAAWVEPFYAADETKEFVYLFVPRKGRSLRLREGGHVVRPRTSGFAWGDYRVPSGALGVLEDVIFHMGPELERSHVLVGLESMPPQALGLEEGVGRDEVFQAVRAGIKAAALARRDDARDRVVHVDLWPDSLVDTCVEHVRIITLDEYRAEVGEEQYAWETNADVR